MTLDEWKSIRSEEWRYERVSKKAKSLWKELGCPQGKDESIWLTAELYVKERDEEWAYPGPGGEW